MMKTNEQNPVVITEEDFNLLKPYFNKTSNKNNEMSLANELNRAVIVKKDAFPIHGIKLNSKVSILDLYTEKIMEFTIVMPQYADMKQNKISILTPMGAALIGFRKSEEVEWKLPAGLRKFRILDVVNE